MLIVAAILAGVVVDPADDAPTWLRLLASVAAVVAVVSAWRVYLGGLRRRRADVGPRTRIVMVDNTGDPLQPVGTAEPATEDTAD
ncbi:MAG TPA: hypothetical protein PLF26_17790 [Blastocatellia bacterium]|nr:hypothetical protein [Blastocatellia bacterium]